MDRKDQWKLFWARLLYPLIYQERTDVSAYFQELSEQELLFPNGQRKKPSLSTLWRKLRAYRQNKFEGLKRKKRSDSGSIRVVAPEVIEKAIELKKDLPSRSALVINDFLVEYYGKSVAESTMYRHLHQAGATKMKLGTVKKPVRCRWTRNHSNSLWVGDFEHGPRVLIDGQAYKTYLSAFIDAHSRYVVDACYYLRENKPTLNHTLLKAWMVHGLSQAIFVDNAKVYHSPELAHACACLEIRLLHRPIRQPESGGIIEKFFQTTQSQFKAEIRAAGICDLDHLNKAFSAWLSVSYHQKIHSETGQSPEQRYQEGKANIPSRTVDMDVATRLFMKRDTRKVHRDFSDISVEGRLYLVDHKLRGDTVVVHWDPYLNQDYVHIYSKQDQYLGSGQLHQREKRDQPHETVTSSKPKHDYITLLINKHNDLIEQKSRGIDYTYAMENRSWPFASFLHALARLLGRKGGTSAFSNTEMQSLSKIYQRFPDLNDCILQEAFVNAEYKNIVDIAYHLQLLNKGK